MFWKISWINVLLIQSVIQWFDAFLFQDKRRMEPYKGTKPDFSNFVALTLENRMPWKTLTSLLKDLAPLLNETREIICILLKQLEILQSTLYKKEKELEMYQKNGSFKESQNNNAVNQNTQESEKQSV